MLKLTKVTRRKLRQIIFKLNTKRELSIEEKEIVELIEYNFCKYEDKTKGLGGKMINGEECKCEHCGKTFYLFGYRMQSAKTVECIFCYKRTITKFGKDREERLKTKGTHKSP